ncbi:MAG: 30S ribosomal protein S5 [Candidatus Caenarcaniphilales bacterium]|nr:30S ribosomal protein S5 [Candidatus Caenarcaniphilales bacterium]
MSEEAKKEENKVENTEVKETEKAVEAKAADKKENNPEAKVDDKTAASAGKKDDTSNAVIGKEAATTSEKSDAKAFNKKKKKKDGGQRRQKRSETQEAEYVEKVVQVRRVTKVVKGGKKLSFRVVVIIGNEKGKVGVGVGKASEVLSAIRKAVYDARKNLVDISMVGSTISHRVVSKSAGSEIMLKPAAEGTGIIAGGTARIVLELAGLGDILAKSKGSKSPLNVARATVGALQSLRSFKEVAKLRGLTVKQMLFA